MAYTPKELTEKYETLWEQVDVLYKEISELQEYVGEIDEKYDTIWSKVSSMHELNTGIDAKYESVWNKCNANTTDIVRLREHINSGLVKFDPQLASIKFEISGLQSKIRLLDKLHEEYKANISHVKCDMFDIQRELKKTNEYIDDKIACFTIIIQLIICVMVLLCLYIMYIVK
jgi:chromosome segregation ATPase